MTLASSFFIASVLGVGSVGRATVAVRSKPSVSNTPSIRRPIMAGTIGAGGGSGNGGIFPLAAPGAGR